VTTNPEFYRKEKYMTREEIRNDIKLKVKELGVKKAYQYFVIENAKAIAPQLKIKNKTLEDKMYIIQLAYGITTKGLKDVNMLKTFDSIFYAENVLEDKVYDEMLEELLQIVS
jgi:hypothetical protein